MVNKGGWAAPAPLTNPPEPIVLFGTGNVADTVYEYFAHDSPYEVVAFSVEREHVPAETKMGLPVVPFESVEDLYGPDEYGMFIAVGYAQLNHLRARIYYQARAKGYRLATYVSSRASVWSNVEIGENCWIGELNDLQSFARIGNDVFLWAANGIGHGAVIKDHAFLAGHVVVPGFTEIGEYCFVGNNATFADSIKIGKDCLIGAGAIVIKDIEQGKVVVPRPTVPRGFDILSGESREMFSPPADPE